MVPRIASKSAQARCLYLIKITGLFLFFIFTLSQHSDARDFRPPQERDRDTIANFDRLLSAATDGVDRSTSKLDWVCQHEKSILSGMYREPEPAASEIDCDSDPMCLGGVHLSIALTSDNSIRIDGSGSVSLDGVSPQYNAITLGAASNRGFNLNSAHDTLAAANGDEWMAGVLISVRPDLGIISKYVQDDALAELDARISSERRRRTPGAEAAADRVVATEVDRQIDAKLAALPGDIDASPGFIQAIQSEREAGVRQIDREIDLAIQGNAELQALPEPFRSQQADLLRSELRTAALAELDTTIEAMTQEIRAELIAQGTSELEARRIAEKEARGPEARAEARRRLERQLKEARASFAQKIERISDRYQAEGTIDQLAIGIARVTNDGRGIVLVKAGKLVIQNGGNRDGTGKTRAERVAGFRDPFAIAGDSANTLAVGVSHFVDLDNGATLEAGANIFHSRLPATDPRQGLSNLLSFLPGDEDFVSRQQDYGNLNSWNTFVRADIDTDRLIASGPVERIGAFASVGEHDKDSVVVVGGEIEFDPGVTITGTYAPGTNNYGDDVFSLQTDLEVADDSYVFYRYGQGRNMLVDGERRDRREHSVGANVLLLELCEPNSIGCTRAYGGAAVTLADDNIARGQSIRDRFSLGANLLVESQF